MDSEENRIVLQAWFGELPTTGQMVEKPSFQIFVEGPVIAERRGKDVSRELVGFVSKEPGKPINFLPVIAAFRDLIPHFEVQIRLALLDWRAEQKAAAEAKVAALEKSVAAAGDHLTKGFAEDALRAAQSVLQSADVQHQVESAVKRSGNAPDEKAIEQLLEDLRKPVEESNDSSDDPDANSQNL